MSGQILCYISDPVNSGCACDIPSVTYQYTWEPNNWSKYYSEAPEIHAYFKRVVDKYGLLKFIKLRHRIDIAEWEETSAQWKVKVSNLADGTAFEDHCDVFINAGGILKYYRRLVSDRMKLTTGYLAIGIGPKILMACMSSKASWLILQHIQRALT